MAPALTLVLAAGDRISRIVAPEDHEYYPVRPMAEEEQTTAAVVAGAELDSSPEQLSSERRRGRIAAAAAIVSGLAFAAGATGTR